MDRLERIGRLSAAPGVTGLEEGVAAEVLRQLQGLLQTPHAVPPLPGGVRHIGQGGVGEHHVGGHPLSLGQPGAHSTKGVKQPGIGG